MNPQAHTPSRSSFPVVLAIIALFLLFWFLTSKVYVKMSEESNPIAASQQPTAEETIAEHIGKAKEKLATASVVDAANGKVRLPLDRAKELVIAENAD